MYNFCLVVYSRATILWTQATQGKQPQSNENDTTIEALPNELIQNILRRLPLIDQIRSVKVCHQWESITLENPQLSPFVELTKKITSLKPIRFKFNAPQPTVGPTSFKGHFSKNNEIICSNQLDPSISVDFILDVNFKPLIPHAFADDTTWMPENVLLRISNQAITPEQRFLLNQVQETCNSIMKANFSKKSRRV